MPLPKPILLLLILSAGSCHRPAVHADGTGEPSFQEEAAKVYAHYSKNPADSLQLKAAHFLIENLTGFSYLEGPQLVQYQKYFKLVNADKDQGAYIMKALAELHEPYSMYNLEEQSDTSHFHAGDMIENIDMAFKVWQEQPWGKDISFEQFREYILPFRLANAAPAYDRRLIYETFDPLLDSVRKAGGDAVAACIALNEQLRKDGWLFTNRPTFMPHFPAPLLLQYRTGSCREMADAAVYIMRAVGIPVGIDFLEQWPHRTQGHNWNIIPDKAGKITMFMGADESPGIPHKPLSPKGKVYRNTYELRPESLAMQNKNREIIPLFLQDARISDVTHEYGACYPVPVSLTNIPSANNSYAYLSVFNNQTWIPISWSATSNDSAVFTNMQGGIAYMPCFYQARGAIPAAYPFILNKEGLVKQLKPDLLHPNKQMIMDRIFPILPDKFDIANFGGSFQGANQPDFSDAVLLYTIGRADPFWNHAVVNQERSFRYLRYITNYGKRCSIGEMEFYTSAKKLSGRLIGTKEPYRNDTNKVMDKAIDGDLATHFESRYTTGAWVGLDLGAPQKIDSIRFAAPCEETVATRIVSGNQYELFYWGHQYKWESRGIHTAKDGRLIFTNVPSNALYLLFNHSREKEAPKRIFTYELGKQIWW